MTETMDTSGLKAIAEAATPGPSIMPWVTWDNPIRYGKWRIYRNDFVAHHLWWTVAWSYTHEDYDGPEDNRHGHCASVDQCVAEIQEREDDDAA